MVRRGHPFDGMELSVYNSWRGADGQLQLRVELPNGRRRTMPASWTSLECPGEDVPRTHGRASDYLGLLKLVETLEDRCGQGRQGDGCESRAAGARSADGSLGKRAGSGSGGPGGTTGAADGAGGGSGTRR